MGVVILPTAELMWGKLLPFEKQEPSPISELVFRPGQDGSELDAYDCKSQHPRLDWGFWTP